MKDEKIAVAGALRRGLERQFRLDLPPPPPRYDPASFAVTEINRAAVELGRALARSDEPAFVVAGTRASGKSHFLSVLAQSAGAPIVAAADVFGAPMEQGVQSASLIGVDDCDSEFDPRCALEFIEAARGRGVRLMLAGTAPVAAWAHGLRDLQTRFAALPAVMLPEPDEDLLSAVIQQHFATRQLKTADGVARYAAPRIARTFAAANAFAEAAAAIAADSSRPINLAVAKKAVGRLLGGTESP
jgi:chromosomal replication initiation ATPase DnaA